MGPTEIMLTETMSKLAIYNNTCHVFINPGGMLIGADWSIKEIEDLLKSADRITESGETAKRMKHGMAVFAYNKWHFLATKEGV